MTRVVITGVGLVTSLGNDVETTWDALCEGRSGIKPITGFDATEYAVRFGGEIVDFDASRYLGHKEARRSDPFTHFAVAAAHEALERGKLTITDEIAPQIGVCIGSGVGGLSTLHDQFAVLFEKGPSRVSPFVVPMMMINAASGTVSIMSGAKGPAWASVSACATSGNAIGEAWETIRRGAAKAMLAGGAETGVTQLTMAAFANMHALSRRNDDPQAASRPFDADRDGFVIAEGAGVLLLEDLDFALERGAPILCGVAWLRLDGGRPPHHGACAGRRRAGPRDADRAAHRQPAPRRRRLHQRARHRDALNDAAETAAIKGGLWRARLSAGRQLDQVDGRAHLRRGRGRRGRRPVLTIARWGHHADDQPRPPRSGVRPRLRAPHRAQGGRARGPLELDGLRRPQRDPALQAL